MNINVNRRQVFTKTRIGILVAVIACLAVSGFFGFRAYQRVKRDRFLRSSWQLFSEKHYPEAGMAARRALAIDPRNLMGTHLMVEITEAMREIAAIQWRKRLVELEPEVLEHRMALARLALFCGDLKTAQETLAAASAAAATKADYYFLSAQVATARHDIVAAELHYAKAVELDPENELYKFHLACTRLQSSDLTTVGAARRLLEAVTEKPTYRSAALRVLFREANSAGELSRAESLGRRIKDLPEATFGDRLRHLASLPYIHHPDFAPTLKSLQAEALSKPEDVHALATWMNISGLATGTIEWLKTMPREMRTALPVPIALAHANVVLSDWSAVKSLVSDDPKDSTAKVWKEWEFARLALQSRILREAGEVEKSNVRWDAAFKEADYRTDSLKALAEFAIEWKWNKEAIDILWSLVEVTKEPDWAIAELQMRYRAADSARDLLRVAAKAVERSPSDAVAHNDLAALSLLLNVNTSDAMKMAADVYKTDPDNPVFASTYAFALNRQGLFAQALRVFSSVKPTLLKDPAYAVYYGVTLAGAGKTDDAKQFLTIASNTPLPPNPRALLSEEKLLAEQTLARIDAALANVPQKTTPAPKSEP